MNEFIFDKSFKRSGVYAIRCKQTNKYYKDQEPEKFIINCILGRLRNLYDIEFNSYYFNYIGSKKGD